MRRLLPSPAPSTAPAPALSGQPHASGPGTIEALAAEYAYPPSADGGRPWLRANMVASLDGAAHHEGRSEPLSNAADMRIFGVLRGLADAVVVGAETVRREGYGPAKEREVFAERRAALGQSPAPAVAVVSASLDLDFSAPLFTRAAVPTVVLTGAGAPPERLRAAREAADVVVAGDGPGVEPARAVRALAERGWSRLLTEGGPRLLAQFAADDLLDELCLTLAPLVAGGDAARIVNGPGADVPRRFALAGLLEEDGFLFTRYRRAADGDGPDGDGPAEGEAGG